MSDEEIHGHIPADFSGHNVFSEEARAKLEGTTVPLVVYEKDGTRREVGKAEIRMVDTAIGPDFQVRGHIDDPELAKMITDVENTFNGGFAIYKDPRDIRRGSS